MLLHVFCIGMTMAGTFAEVLVSKDAFKGTKQQRTDTVSTKNRKTLKISGTLTKLCQNLREITIDQLVQ